MINFNRIGAELYDGRRSFDFIGKRALWYTISLVVVAAALGIVFFKGLTFGIEFTGGVQYRVSAPAGEVDQSGADELREEVAATGIEGASNPIVTTTGGDQGASYLVQTESLSLEENSEVEEVIRGTAGVGQNAISQTEIGPSWGAEVAKRALIGIAVFLTLVVLFIWGYFREWKMSVAALVALIHDVTLTIGVYSLSGFTVTPAAVTGLLAVLGFSLYDTVVIFDKVRENTKQLGRSRLAWDQAANLAVNQTVVRSINTSVSTLLPIGAILYVSAIALGASSLKDLALAQFVGMGVGIFSSLFVAPRLLVHMKSNETEVVLEKKRAKARQRAAADKYAAVPTTHGPSDGSDEEEPDELAQLEEDLGERPAERTPLTRSSADAVGQGRVLPTQSRSVTESPASGRKQPRRESRSRRRRK